MPMIIKNVSILTENIEIQDNVNVYISEDRIKKIESAEKESEHNLHSEEIMEDHEIMDGSNYLLMPAFFNSHGHSPMSLMRGYGENMNLQDWLFTKIFPFEDKLTDEAVYYGTLLSMAESFKYGIVSTNDMYYFIDAMVAAVKESKGKVNVSRAIANPEGIPFDELPSVEEMKDVVSKYHGTENGRILIDGALHAEYTSNEETAISLSNLTEELGIRMHVHLSETQVEHEECKLRHNGKTPAKYLYDAGLFRVPTVAAHSVWVEDDDIKILSENNVIVATNPVSNLKLASGICDVKKLLDGGVRVAIGTDSVASNNNLSMFEEMKTMMLLTKVLHRDPTIISPREALLMATRNGAISQVRNDTGLVKEGFKADLILLKKNSPNMQPVHDMVNNIVLSATDSDIYMTLVDGECVYRDGEFPTIDMDDVIKGTNRAVNDILSRL